MYQEARSGVLTEPAALAPLGEGAAGIAVIVLTIIGLAAVASASMASIATIVIGAGLLVEAANTAMEYGRVTQVGTAVTEVAEPGADMTVEFMAGGAGIVLGILALIGINAVHLVPAALIVFGAALLLAGASPTLIGTVMPGEGMSRSVSWRSELAPARGIQMLIGVAAVILGILSLVIMADNAVLALVGLLAVGAGLLATSANFTRAMLTTFSR
jgi:hypothetical protein